MAKAWINETIYVNIETGEIINKKLAKQLDKIKKTIKINYSGRENRKTTTIECKTGIRLF